MDAKTVERFAHLYTGRTDAYGTGEGRWIKQPVTLAHYEAHLRGFGKGLGIAPLRDDGTIRWAAIDLDEPDFDAARDMQKFLPGDSFIEKSRSGNAHVLVFFKDDVPAWPVRGILKAATEAAGKSSVEVFPKQDRLFPELRSPQRPELGNYLNLAFHGDQRPIFALDGGEYAVDEFVHDAEELLNDPQNWIRRAEWLQVPSPEERLSADRTEFGTQRYVHPCIEHIIANREQNPVIQGHRNVVYFNVAKGILNTEGYGFDEAMYFLRLLNDSSPDRVPEQELLRIARNAERGQWTSTGCDDALMSPYVLSSCPVLNKNG
jgi:hypothetical protein